MPPAVTSNLLFYVDDSCLMYQHRDVNETEKQLNKDFENACDWWFVNNKLSIHFDQDKTKSILLASKRKIKYKNIKIKPHSRLHILVVFWTKFCVGNLWP